MIAPHQAAPWAALAARDASAAPSDRWWPDCPPCGRPAPLGTCDVLHSCCRLPHDPARFTRRVILGALAGDPYSAGWVEGRRRIALEAA